MPDHLSLACRGGQKPRPALPPLSMAFQPILRWSGAGRELFGFEALVRGPAGEGAGSVMAQVNHRNRFAFDRCCRLRAIELAAELGLAGTGAALSLNILPGAATASEACIRATLAAARRAGLSRRHLILEMTEQEAMLHPAQLQALMDGCRALGFRIAIDDFGAGYSGLVLLTRFRPDIVKLDMELLRGVDADPARRVILRHLAAMCAELGIAVVAEGVETRPEFEALRDLGIQLFQGYYFGRPGFEHLPGLAA
ncbi:MULTISPECIES: EAL domain-containing protein [Acetobacterales]|uniref:EAL domain-containing protein n=1 Tax=Roseomonas sp. WGS1072 TaxID=3366816 RepID=UPI003BF2964A